jgi:hypothetical protein
MALSPRAISRTRIQHAFASRRQALIAFFTKILSEVSPQAESEQTGDTKHGYPVVASVSPAIS